MPNNPSFTSSNDVISSVSTPAVSSVAAPASSSVPAVSSVAAPASSSVPAVSSVAAPASTANSTVAPAAAPANPASSTLSGLTNALSEPISQAVSAASTEIDSLANAAGQQVDSLGNTVTSNVNSFLNNPALNQNIENKADSGLKKLSNVLESFTNEGTTFLKTLLTKVINSSSMPAATKAELLTGLNLGATTAGNFLNAENVKLEAAAEKFIAKELPIVEKEIEAVDTKVVNKIEIFAKEEIADLKAFFHKLGNKAAANKTTSSNDLQDENSTVLEIVYTEFDVAPLGDSVDNFSSDM